MSSIEQRRAEDLKVLVREAFPTMSLDACCRVVSCFAERDIRLLLVPEIREWVVANSAAISKWADDNDRLI